MATLGLNRQAFVLFVETESRLLVTCILERSGDKDIMFFCEWDRLASR